MGWNSGTITNSYHDSTVSGITGGTAKTSLTVAIPACPVAARSVRFHDIRNRPVYRRNPRLPIGREVSRITGDTAKTSVELARPTTYGTTGIYADWNVDVDVGNGNPPVAAFRGNGKTISHFYIIRSAGADASVTGLFGALGSSSSVTNPGLPDASVAPTAADRLAGNRAAPASVTYAQGSVSASGANAVAGGLEGRDSGTITAAYAMHP